MRSPNVAVAVLSVLSAAAIAFIVRTDVPRLLAASAVTAVAMVLGGISLRQNSWGRYVAWTLVIATGSAWLLAATLEMLAPIAFSASLFEGRGTLWHDYLFVAVHVAFWIVASCAAAIVLDAIIKALSLWTELTDKERSTHVLNILLGLIGSLAGAALLRMVIPKQ